jgi:hypothetical protein
MRLIKSRLIGEQSGHADNIPNSGDRNFKDRIFDHRFCPNVEKEWVKRMEELVPHVSCRYTTKKMTKGRISDGLKFVCFQFSDFS